MHFILLINENLRIVFQDNSLSHNTYGKVMDEVNQFLLLPFYGNDVAAFQYYQCISHSVETILKSTSK